MRSGISRTILIVAALAFVASASVYGYYNLGMIRVGGNPPQETASEENSADAPSSSEFHAMRGEAFEMRFDDALLVCESGSLIRGTNLSVSGIDQGLPPLGAGMVNVTSGHSGYRFLPHGEHFRKAAGIQIGYDKDKLPKGFTSKDIYTYYYNESSGQWKRLQRDSVSDGTVYSRTTHFTDMINAVVSHPEMPEGQEFTPTGLKDLKAADPSAGITLAEVSAGNNQGGMTVSYPIELPAGRKGMQPRLGISYSSDGGSGLLGTGWDMPIPSISVDSRWGAPRYDGAYETECYVYEGDELLPSPRYNQQWERRNTNGAKTFHRRTESGFEIIERHGNSPKNYYWIVTDKSGTKYYYGTYAGLAAMDTVLLKDDYGNISRWPLCRVEDADGNYMSYHYEKRRQHDEKGRYLGQQLWLESIVYTGNSKNGEDGRYYVFFGSDSNKNQCTPASGTTNVGIRGIDTMEKNTDIISESKSENKGDSKNKSKSKNNKSLGSVQPVPMNLCNMTGTGTSDLFVEIRKYDRRTGNPIPGAVFELSCPYLSTTATTDINGEAAWSLGCMPQNMPLTLNEISAPGYCDMVSGIEFLFKPDSTKPTITNLGNRPDLINSTFISDHYILIELFNDECPECFCDSAKLEIFKMDGSTMNPMNGVEFEISYTDTTFSAFTDNSGWIKTPLPRLRCGEDVTINEKSFSGYCDSLTNFKFRMHKDNPYEPCVPEIVSEGQSPFPTVGMKYENNKLTLIVKDQPCSTQTSCECGPLEIDIKKFKRVNGIEKELGNIPFAITIPDEGTHIMNTSADGDIHFEIDQVNCHESIKIDELESDGICKFFEGFLFSVDNSSGNCEIHIIDSGDIQMIKDVSVNGMSLTLQIYNEICDSFGLNPPTPPNIDSIENNYIIKPIVPDFYADMDTCDCEREYPKDNRNEARSGHLQSTRDKLRRILVYFDNERVRSYSFCYGEDSYGRAQLRSIKQWGRNYNGGSREHRFEYYLDRNPNSMLDGDWHTINTVEFKNPLLNFVKKLQKPIERTLSSLTGSQTVLGGNFNLSIGGNGGAYVGLGSNTVSKINSVSYDVGASYGTGFGTSTLCDIDGDGLTDRLFVIFDDLYYQKQQNGTFLPPARVSGASKFLRDKRVTVNHGPQLNAAGITGGVSWTNTTNTTSTYLSDFDGDGLPDIIDNSNIRRLGARYNAPTINISTDCGAPAISQDTVPKYPCVEVGGLDSIDFEDIDDLYEQPYYDIIKVWDGDRMISAIDAKAWMGDTVKGATRTDDTVILSVEYYGHTDIPGGHKHVLIASDTLVNGDTIWQGDLLDPQNGYLSQEYIDSVLNQCPGEERPYFGEGKLFFRARSLDGRDISREIHWNPQVMVYNSYLYPTHGQRSDVAAFAMGGGMFQSPGTGQAALRVPTHNADFTDTVRMNIYHNGTRIKTLRPNSTAAWDTLINLSENDSLRFAAEGDTATIWKNNVWKPYLYFKNIEIEGVTYNTLTYDTLAGGTVDTIKMMEYHIVPHYPCYDARFTHFHKSRFSLPFGYGFGGWYAVQYRHDDNPKIDIAKLHSMANNRPVDTTGMMSQFGDLTDSTYLQGLNDTTLSGDLQNIMNFFGCMPLTGNGANERMEGVYPNAYVKGGYISLGVVTDTLSPTFADDSIPCGGGSGNGGNIAGGGNSGNGSGSGGGTRSGGTRSGGSPNSFKSGTLDKVSKSKTFSYTLAVVSGGNVDSWMEHDLMDLNGDGRPDIIHGSSVNYTKPYIYPEYENTKRQPFSGIGSHPYNSHSKSRGVVRMGEFAEICTQTAISGKGSSFIRGLGASYVNDSVFRTLADLNGDGLPDIVCSDGNVSLGTGYGFLNPQKWDGLEEVGGSKSVSLNSSGGSFSIWSDAVSGGVGLCYAKNSQTAFLSDINGDGLPDLVKKNPFSGKITYRANKGNGFDSAWTVWRAESLSALDEHGISNTVSLNLGATAGFPVFFVAKVGGSAAVDAALSLSNEKIQISDFDGDGMADLLKSTSRSELKVKYSRIGRTGLLKSISLPTGGTVTADYRMTDPTVYHQRRWVVKEIKSYDGLPGDGNDTMRTTYSYSNGFYDRDEKAFLGFAKVTETRWNGDTVHTVTDKYFSNSDIHTKGILLLSNLRDSRGNIYVQNSNNVQNTVLDVWGDAERVFPHITRSQTCFFEGQPTASIVKWQESDYDLGNGNVVRQRYGSTDQPMVEVEIYYHPQYNGNYIVNRVQSVEIQGMRLRTTDIDTLGRYIAIMDYDGQNNLVTNYEFDSYGNITAMRTPNTAFYYTYEDTAHIYPETVTDTFGVSSHLQDYDMRYGVPLTVTDRAGNSMEYTLDSWGRPLTIRGPKEIADGIPFTIRYSYRKPAAGQPACAVTEHYDPQHGNNTIKTYTYCDGLGRVVQTRHEAEVQGVEKLVVSGHTVFDGLGRAVATYHPTEAHRDSTRFAFAVDAITPSTATYDVLDRPLVQTAPDGSTTRYAYGFCGSHLQKKFFETAVTDPNGNTGRTLKDADGKPWAAKVAGQPWLYYDYNPVGELMRVYSSTGDWDRNYNYDMLGRRTSYSEDNLETHYTYDGLNPATETHKWQENGQPKQKKITRRYIAHRLDSVIYSDSTLPTVYRYDYAGRVETVLDESGRMDYSYGNMGEVTAETRTYALPFLASDLALTTQYEYDSWGRTQTVTYPDGETVKYAYDLGGQLYRIFNVQNQYYMDSVRYDKFGAVTSRKYGNGLKMQYAYHPQNRRLTGTTTFNGNSQLSHTAYTYDAAGNITRAVSSYPWLAGQTFTETFAYDSTHQLVSAANAQTYALSVTYGDWGKIQQYDLSQTDLASNTTTSQTRYYSYGSLNEGQTTFAPNSISYADGTNVNEQYGINGSLSRRETATPGNAPSEELYRFGADGNLRLYSYDRLFYSLYGYDAGTTRTYKYSFDLTPNWVNGRLEAVNFNMRTAMFYPNAYINFNSNGYYTKHYYNGMERIASRLGEQNLSINVNDPELQDRKDWQDSLIRKNIVEITGYEFLEPGEEQTLEDPKPVFELPQIGLNNLIPNTSSVYYYHPNHLGSTCYVTDGNASVVQGFLYAPFGEITNEHNSSFGSSVLPKYSFNAKELDEETGMYYYEARYMAPPVFISRDPLFEKYPTFSPYAYCVNNPVKYIDPTGEEIVIFGENGKDKYYWDNGNVWKAHGSKREPIKDSEKLWGDLGKTIRSLNQINSTKEGKYILSKLSASSNEYRIRNEQKGDAYACYVRSEKTVYTNGHNDIGVLSHELFHAFQDLNGRGGASIYNEVEAYVFQGMVSKSLNIKDYNSGMEASPILNKKDADKYVNAMQQLVTGFKYDDFKYAIENFKEASKANYSERRYDEYDLLPNTHVLITGSLLKKIR